MADETDLFETPKPVTQQPPAPKDDYFYTGVTNKPVAPAPQAGPMTGMQVVKSAYEHLGPSAVKAAQDVIYPFTHAPETIAGLKTMGAGLASKAAPYVGSQYRSPEGEQAIGSVADYYKQRYGSVEGAKRAFAEDPVGTMMDVSTVFTGAGGALRGAGLGAAKAAEIAGTTGRIAKGLGTAGEIIGETGRLVDPVAATTKLGAMAAEPITKGLVPGLFSVQSGKSFEGLRRAEEAGATGNKEFFRNIVGGTKPEEVVEQTRDALQAIKDQRSQEYLNTSQGWKSSQTPLTLSPVNLKLSDIINEYTPTGGKVARYMQAPINEIRDTINHYAGTRKTMSDLDLLKRDLDKLYYQPEFRSPEAKAALTQVRQEVWNTISSHDPVYADIMGKYEQATSEINNIISDIGTDKTGTAARLRKLIKAAGSETINRLAKERPDLPYALAGQELSTVFPGGIRGAIAGSLPYLAGYSIFHPAALAGIAAASPFVAGTTQAALGAARTLPMQLEQMALPQAARRTVLASQRPELATAREEMPAEETEDYFYKRAGRATGGRIGRGMTSQMLIAAVERAKAEGQKSTESILEQPDEHVVRALKVANENI